MLIKPNWDNFEWFYYLLFSKEYNQPYGTHRYKNQSGIETDPINLFKMPFIKLYLST